MYCTQCGQPIEDGSRYCRHCGAAQEPEAGARRGTPEPAITPPVQAKTKGTSVGRAFGIIGAVLIAMVIFATWLGGPSSTSSSQSENANMLADNLESQADNMAAMADNVTAADSAGTTGGGASAASSPWTYTTNQDKIRGATTYYARTTSTNTIHQAAPYDSETSMTMTVRKHPSFGTDVVLTISSGQMMCPSYEGCSGTVRFDNGPAQRVRFNGPADDSNDTVFVAGTQPFIAKLKKAKHVVIEKTLYQAGNPQFEFDVSGLKWTH